MQKRKLLYLSPIVLALVLTLFGTLTHGFSGVDIHFHLGIAEHYSVGDFKGGFEYAYSVDKTFYPPLFHFALVPGFWLGNAEALALVYQVAFLPLAVATFMFLVYKLHGLRVAFFGGLLVLGSMAYLDRVIQAQPHALDFILLPLSFYAFLFVKNRGWLASSALAVWNHGLVSMSMLGGVLVGQVKRRNWKPLIIFSCLVWGVLFASFMYLSSGLQGYGAAVDTDQEYLFWHDPFFAVGYLGLLSLGFVVAGYFIYRYLKGNHVSTVSKLSILTIMTTAVMVPMWADRWLQYSTIPLALLILEHATSTTNGKLQYLWKVGIMFSLLLSLEAFI